MQLRVALMGTLLWASACAEARRPVESADSDTRDVVDSVVPRDTAIARFQATTQKVDSFAGGAGSRDELVRRWVKAVEAVDTAALRQMVVNRDEFAWLIYPTSKQGLPPYDLGPELMWFTLSGRSEKGIARLLQDRGGKSLRYVSYSCDRESSREGDNTLHGPCLIKRETSAGATVEERLFGLIVERGGEWKFLSYGGKFD